MKNAKSIRAKLYNLAKQEQIDFQTILTRYFHESVTINFDSIVFAEDFYKDAKRIEMWNTFLNKIDIPTIKFETVIKTIQNKLKEIKL